MHNLPRRPVIRSGGGAEPATERQVPMAVEPDRKLSDDELDELARQLFAEVRRETSEAQAERALQSAGEVAGEVVPILPDWLLDAGGDGAA